MDALLKNRFGKIHSIVICEEYFDGDCDAYFLEGFDGRKRHSSISRCKFFDGANLVFSLPTVTKNIYVTISDGDPSVIRQVLATLEDMESERRISLGNLVLFEDPVLRRQKICGVILLNADLFNALDYLPNKATVDHIEHNFISVVFLTDEEHEIWKVRGHDALIDYWTEIDKDLIKFGA